MVGVAIGAAFVPTPAPRRFWIAGALCAMLPDIDAVGRPFHAGDVAWLGGHRALTHSFAFAVALGLVVALSGLLAADWRQHWMRFWLYLTIATAMHGVLDAFASYGTGVMFLAPFSNVRYRADWRPFGGLLSDTFLGFLPAFLAARIVLQIRHVTVPRALRVGPLIRFLTAAA